MIVVNRYLLALRQVQLIALVVYQQHFTLPHLIDLAADYGVHTVLVLLVERVVLQLQNLRGQGLAKVQNGAAAELLEVHLLRHLFAHLIVGLYLLSLAQGYLLVLVCHLTVLNDDTITVNLKVTLVGVHNHVEVLVRTEHLGYHIAEALFEHTHQCGAVNVLGFFKFLKGLNH